jgi:hypothetical protein
MAIYNGATPTLSFAFKDEGITQADKAILTFSVPNGKPIIEKTNEDMELRTDTSGETPTYYLDVFLSQEETLYMPKVVNAQFNFVYFDGVTNYRAVSEIVQIAWKRNLHDEVIEVTV